MKRLFRRLALFIIKGLNLSGNAEIIKKQAFLNPADRGYRKAERYRVEKLSEVLMVLFLGVLVTILAAFASGMKESDVENRYIERNGYGGGDKTVDIIANIDGREIEEPIEVTVRERRYTDEEREKIFDEIGKSLPDRILGENESLEHVEYDLDLMDSIEGYPVTVEWATDNYDVLDSSGYIQEEVRDSRGTPVVLTATLNYMGQYADYEFPVMVFPRHKEITGKIRDIVLKKILKIDDLTLSADTLILPEKIGDSHLSYKRAESPAWVFILAATLVTALVIWYGRDRDLDKLINIREKEMLTDYPDIVSRLNLFFFSGMTIRGAFEKIAGDYEERLAAGKIKKRFAFEEMLVTLREMKGGVTESQAYQNFGARSGIRRYGKLGTLLSQNLQKGNAGLMEALEAEAKDAFEERKANAKKVGEEAGTKLLLPMGIMLMVAMIMVILPAFLSFSL